MELVKLENEDDDYDDDKFTRQFTKHEGSWVQIELLTCEYCEKKNCDRCLYGDKLDDKLDAVGLEEGENNEKRYSMYRAFIFWKHGQMGSDMRVEIDGCVIDHILQRFPVEAGKGRRRFLPVSNPQE